jgi:putative addiction module killer protein
MPEARKCRFVPTGLFTPWLNGMDGKTLGRILKRLDDAKNGNFGDHASVGEGVFEMRLHFGPGYRILPH